MKWLPVRVVKFAQSQDGPGFSVKSSLSQEEGKRPSRWRIAYEPTLRLLRVDYQAPDAKTPADVGYIPVERIASLTFAAELDAPAPAVQAPALEPRAASKRAT